MADGGGTYTPPTRQEEVRCEELRGASGERFINHLQDCHKRNIEVVKDYRERTERVILHGIRGTVVYKVRHSY